MLKEENKEQGRKMVWYKSGKIQEVKVSEPKSLRSKFWFKKNDSKELPKEGTKKSLTWFGKLIKNFLPHSEVIPKDNYKKSFEVTNSTDNAFESDQRVDG